VGAPGGRWQGHPRAVKIFFRCNLQGNFVSAHQAEQEASLGHFLLGGRYLELYLVVLIRPSFDGDD